MLRHCAYIVTFVPSVLRWKLAETKPGDPLVIRQHLFEWSRDIAEERFRSVVH
jgi:hypothetical protein